MIIALPLFGGILKAQFLPEFRKILRRSITACIFTLFVFGGTASAVRQASDKTSSPSNLDLMTTLSTEVVEELVDSLDPKMINLGIRLKPYAGGENYRLLNNIFMSVCKSRGIKIYAPAARPAQPKTTTGKSAAGQGQTAAGQGQTTAGQGQATAGQGQTAAGQGQSAAGPESVVDAGAAKVPVWLEYETLEFSLAYEKVYRSHLIGGKRVKRRADLKVLAKLVAVSDAEVMWIGETSAERSDQFSFGDVDRVEAGTFQFTKPAHPTTGWGKLVEPVFVSGIIVGMIYLFFSNQSDS